MSLSRDPEVGILLTRSLALHLADMLTLLPWGGQQLIAFVDDTHTYEVTRLPGDQSVSITRVPVGGFRSQDELFSSLENFRKAYAREDCLDFLTPETLERLVTAISVSGVTYVGAGRMAIRRMADGSIELHDTQSLDEFKSFVNVEDFQKRYAVQPA